jgi:hypothetical protein
MPAPMDVHDAGGALLQQVLPSLSGLQVDVEQNDFAGYSIKPFAPLC